MSFTQHELDDLDENNTWPAFADLFSATSLLFVTFLCVFIYISLAQQGATNTTRLKIMRRLVIASEGGTLFTVDSTDRQFVRIVLRERATFPAGSFRWETLREEGKAALTQIGRVLNDDSLRVLYREVRVLGHSDQVPFLTAGFTNWELSASRAAVVARFLVNWVQVDPCKISATGRGPYFPVNSQDLEANRRIEIQILPRLENGNEQSSGSCSPDGDGTRAYARDSITRRDQADSLPSSSDAESRGSTKTATLTRPESVPPL